MVDLELFHPPIIIKQYGFMKKGWIPLSWDISNNWASLFPLAWNLNDFSFSGNAPSSDNNMSLIPPLSVVTDMLGTGK
jgi:hypothetical protein